MEKRYLAVGLTKEEYDKVLEVLGREPNDLELNMYGAMWSEHCSYKHSRVLFKHFPTSNKRVLQGPGENAGIVDIGDNLAVVMKIESHNSPSAVEPFDGAATGVGGIIRDIFAMGARPVALLNSLRFGDIENNDRVKFLLKGVVEGMAYYGEGMELPIVGGEIYFNNSYNENPLVNAMCVGLIEHDKIYRANAKGLGNPVIYIGAPTGRDGVGGASFSSMELSEEAEKRSSSVPKGYPELEKRVMEACLELLKTGYVVGLQDMGAAGLISASCETATSGEGGMEIDVLKVPRSEENMTATEIMLSETQERMLLIVEKGREAEIEKIVKKWDLESFVIGKVTDDGLLKIMEGNEVVGQIPAASLDSDGAPKYYKDYKVPAYIKDVKAFDNNDIKEPEDYNEVLIKLLTSPNIASKEWAYEQFNQEFNQNVIVKPGSNAGVFQVEGTKKGVAVTTDCNSRFCYLDPREGSKIAVTEAARNIICSGAMPLAITDGLNFASPERPESFWQLRESVLGLSEACRELDTPVISGNVSSYNETEDYAIYPTPIVGMVGVLEDVDKVCTMDFKSEGDIIILLGKNTDEIGGSEYLSRIHGLEKGQVPFINFALEKKLQGLVLSAIEAGMVQSAQDLSEGGLAVTLAESVIAGKLGAKINIDIDMRKDLALFSEGQSRFLLTVKEVELENLKEKMDKLDLPYEVLGEVGGKSLEISIKETPVINLSVDEMEEAWRGALKCIME